MTNNCCGVLLAAGQSLRFGSNKLLHPLPGGTPVALASARALQTALPRVVVTVRKESTELIQLMSGIGLDIVVISDADSGMGHSISAGVAASLDASGWIVALADMPFIQPMTIKSVAKALDSGAPLVAPSYERQRGHPVGFSSRFRNELLALTGDQGARSILLSHANELQLVSCTDRGVTLDIDLPTDIRLCS